MATATNANKAVIIRAMINPIIETQISSTRCADGLTAKKIKKLIKIFFI
jgi:hypothetical protein